MIILCLLRLLLNLCLAALCHLVLSWYYGIGYYVTLAILALDVMALGIITLGIGHEDM